MRRDGKFLSRRGWRLDSRALKALGIVSASTVEMLQALEPQVAQGSKLLNSQPLQNGTSPCKLVLLRRLSAVSVFLLCCDAL